MYVLSATLKISIPHAASLKDKRQVSRSIIEKTRRKFNVSISEVATQQSPQTLTIGLAVVSGEYAHAQNSLEEIIRYIEENTDGELVGIERET